MSRGNQSLRSMADVVESLLAEFESTLEMTTVVRVVRSCQREMAISGSSSPETLHLRARGRLQALVEHRAHAAGAGPSWCGPTRGSRDRAGGG